MKKETSNIFLLFIEKTDEMLQEEFVQILKNNPKISFTYNSEQGLTQRTAPSITSIKSVATNYRIFTSAENISIGSLSKILKDPDISEHWKDRYQKAREKLNNFLDEETNLHIGEGGKPLTRRYIVDIFINGWIFHVKDENKTALYRRWSEDTLIFHALEQEFIMAVHEVSRAVEYIAQLCRDELARSPAA